MLDESEQWQPVLGYEGLYEVSSHGRVRSLDRYVTRDNKWGTKSRTFQKGRVLAPKVNSRGYLSVGLSKEGDKWRTPIHVLVCHNFHGPKPTPEHEVLFEDRVRDNPHMSNLRWATRSEIVSHCH